MKVKFLKESGQIKAGDVHIVNSQEQVDYLVGKGLGEVVEEGHTRMPFVGRDVNRSEDEVRKENAMISGYSAVPAGTVDTPINDAKKPKKA